MHEESIVLIDRLVQNYLSNLRRAINRVTRFIDHRVPANSAATSAAGRALFKRHAPLEETDKQEEQQQQALRESMLSRIQQLSTSIHELTVRSASFSAGSARQGRQTSPLWDRIPPRGTELWRDFWDTVRKQVRRINQEVRKIYQDMGRLVTGQPAAYKYLALDGAQTAQVAMDNDMVANNRLEEDDKLSEAEMEQFDKINVFDEQDDEFTSSELERNVALRQQIQQEIGVFGSIFDMMQAFVRRLRETARNMVRDVLDPNGSPNNNNNGVTPGPDIRPQVDKLLEETIEAQRHINSQSRPVYLPNDRDRNVIG